MLLAVSIVCAMVYLIVCALGNGVDGQNLSKKPQDVIQTGPAWAEDKILIRDISSGQFIILKDFLNYFDSRFFELVFLSGT